MKALGQILLYLAATVLLGALLAPPCYWIVSALAANLPQGNLASFLAHTDFHRCYDRAMLIAALLLLWPLLRALRVRDFNQDLGLRRDRRAWSHLVSGLVVALASLLVLGGILLLTSVYHLRGHFPWARLARLPATAAVVAIIEEWLFRGAIQGAVRKTTVDSFAIFSVAVLFAAVHFLKPPAHTITPGETIHWWSGFSLLPDAFWQFSQPLLLLGGFTTLLLVGLILGYARFRTRSLWMPIGLHSGWILGKMGFLQLTKAAGPRWPWVGPDILTGLAPIFALLAAWAVVWWMLRDESFF